MSDLAGFAMPTDPEDDRDHRRKVAQRIIPAPGRVVLLPLDAVTKTDSGIYLPGAEEEKTALAEVISFNMGDPAYLTSLGVPNLTIGSTVLYQKYQPIVYEVDGVLVFVIKQEFIDGVLGAEASS